MIKVVAVEMHNGAVQEALRPLNAVQDLGRNRPVGHDHLPIPENIALQAAPTKDPPEDLEAKSAATAAGNTRGGALPVDHQP